MRPPIPSQHGSQLHLSRSLTSTSCPRPLCSRSQQSLPWVQTPPIDSLRASPTSLRFLHFFYVSVSTLCPARAPRLLQILWPSLCSHNHAWPATGFLLDQSSSSPFWILFLMVALSHRPWSPLSLEFAPCVPGHFYVPLQLLIWFPLSSSWFSAHVVYSLAYFPFISPSFLPWRSTPFPGFLPLSSYRVSGLLFCLFPFPIC